MKYLIAIKVLGETDIFDFPSRELRDAFVRDLVAEGDGIEFATAEMPDGAEEAKDLDH
jgi:hypothetical protein